MEYSGYEYEGVYRDFWHVVAVFALVIAVAVAYLYREYGGMLKEDMDLVRQQIRSLFRR